MTFQICSNHFGLLRLLITDRISLRISRNENGGYRRLAVGFVADDDVDDDDEDNDSAQLDAINGAVVLHPLELIVLLVLQTPASTTSQSISLADDGGSHRRQLSLIASLLLILKRSTFEGFAVCSIAMAIAAVDDGIKSPFVWL